MVLVITSCVQKHLKFILAFNMNTLLYCIDFGTLIISKLFDNLMSLTLFFLKFEECNNVSFR
jgi:hypothetical protein